MYLLNRGRKIRITFFIEFLLTPQPVFPAEPVLDYTVYGDIL